MKILNVLVDHGHEETTPGKRSPVWPNGKQLLEYQFNYEVAKKLVAKCKAYPQLNPVMLFDNTKYVSLTGRCKAANKYSNRSVFISIHGNAGPETASGFEIFTSPGTTKADELAEFIYLEVQKFMPAMKMRADMSDNDHDKEARFTVLANTSMPAVLSENGFFTNYEECMKMLTDEFQNKIVDAHVQGILKFYDKYYAD